MVQTQFLSILYGEFSVSDCSPPPSLVGEHSEVSDLHELLSSPTAAFGFEDAQSDGLDFRLLFEREEAPFVVAPVQVPHGEKRFPFVLVADPTDDIERSRRATSQVRL